MKISFSTACAFGAHTCNRARENSIPTIFTERNIDGWDSLRSNVSKRDVHVRRNNITRMAIRINNRHKCIFTYILMYSPMQFSKYVDT